MKNIKIWLLFIVSGINLYGSDSNSNSSAQSVRTQSAIIQENRVGAELTRAQSLAQTIMRLSAQLPEDQQGPLGSSMSVESLLADDLRATCQKKITELLFLNNEEYCAACPDNAPLQEMFNRQKNAVNKIKQCHKDRAQAVNLEGLEERKARAYLEAFWSGIRLHMTINRLHMTTNIP